jgi:two-component system, OmpR family, response regulator ChvI
MGNNTVVNCEPFPRRSMRILVVDDEKDIALVLKKGLESQGFKADAFDRPECALMNFRAGSYDLILTDMRMPKMDGLELYQEIRKIDAKVKVCFLSAYEELKKMLPSTEPICFIKKPVSISNLSKIVKSELGSR